MEDILSLRQGETPDQHLVRVCIAKRDKKVDLDWIEIRDHFDLSITPDQLRKEASGMKQAYEAFLEDIQSQGDNEAFLTREEYEKALNRIAKQEVKLQYERQKNNAMKNSLNKDIRVSARADLINEKVIKAIEDRPALIQPEKLPRKTEGVKNKKYIVTIADTHYGRGVEVLGLKGEVIAEYSTAVFEERMWDLYDQIADLVEEMKIDELIVLNLSDSIDGILRVSQLQTLEKGLVDSILDYSEFMSMWLNDLSALVSIDYHSVQGNHTEDRPLASQKNDFPLENHERLITKFIELQLVSNDRVTVHENKPFEYLEIFETKVLATHGQNERNLENSLKDYITFYNREIHMLITGHLHYANNKTIGFNGDQNIEFLQSPSICGIDDYSARLKKSALAGALLIQFTEGVGKTAVFDMKL